MPITDIEYNTLKKWLTAIRLRKPRLLAYLGVLISPVSKYLYPKFKEWERQSWYDLKYQDGTVAHLEYVLNDHFDPILKRIWIGPGTYPERQYIYLDAEEHPLYIYRDSENHPVWLYTQAELDAGAFDFTIHIPYGLPFEETTMRAVADRYKRDGKNYTIVYF